MTQKTDYREPEMGSYGDEPQYNCRWPGCEFDTLDKAQWDYHIDPVSGAHREPLGLPGSLPHPIGADERAELDDLRAEKEAAASAAAVSAPKGEKAKGE